MTSMTLWLLSRVVSLNTVPFQSKSKTHQHPLYQLPQALNCFVVKELFLQIKVDLREEIENWKVNFMPEWFYSHVIILLCSDQSMETMTVADKFPDNVLLEVCFFCPPNWNKC
ncbi:hypothetical protein DFJ73DRAFT_524536 [Zopfochytrium polystomum]|nr:hypothetical protein DFJ73DRAFT_524536 [Zopfochytrium polystomum]